MTFKTPTFDDIRQELYLEEVSTRVVGEWRWGNVYEGVYRFNGSDKLWAATYRISADGETNELRENPAAKLCYEVKAVVKMHTEYVRV